MIPKTYTLSVMHWDFRPNLPPKKDLTLETRNHFNTELNNAISSISKLPSIFIFYYIDESNLLGLQQKFQQTHTFLTYRTPIIDANQAQSLKSSLKLENNWYGIAINEGQFVVGPNKGKSEGSEQIQYTINHTTTDLSISIFSSVVPLPPPKDSNGNIPLQESALTIFSSSEKPAKTWENCLSGIQSTTFPITFPTACVAERKKAMAVFLYFLGNQTKPAYNITCSENPDKSISSKQNFTYLRTPSELEFTFHPKTAFETKLTNFVNTVGTLFTDFPRHSVKVNSYKIN